MRPVRVLLQRVPELVVAPRQVFGPAGLLQAYRFFLVDSRDRASGKRLGGPFSDPQRAAGAACAAERTGDARLGNIDRCPFCSSTAFSAVASGDASPMSAYQGFRLFSQVVIGLMAAGIVYAAYIAITYWTGISV